MSLVHLLSGDLITDRADLARLTEFDATGTSANVDRSYIYGAPETEGWWRIGDAFNSSRLKLPSFMGRGPGAVAGDPATEGEIHVALTPDAGSGVLSTDLINIGLNTDSNSQSNTTRLLYIQAIGAGDGSGLSRLALNSAGTSYTLPLTYLIPGEIINLVARIRSQNVDDTELGRMEIWINGTLGFEIDTAFDNVSMTWLRGGTDEGYLDVSFKGSSGAGNAVLYRNIQVYDAWTTPDSVAPSINHVVEATPVSAIGADYSANNAPDILTAISDQEEITSAITTTSQAPLDIAYSVPAKVADLPVLAVLTRLRLAKTSTAANQIDVETLNDDGSLSYRTKVVLTEVSPARETVVVVHEPVGMTADDVNLRLINGA